MNRIGENRNIRDGWPTFVLFLIGLFDDFTDRVKMRIVAGGFLLGCLTIISKLETLRGAVAFGKAEYSKGEQIQFCFSHNNNKKTGMYII